MSKKRLLVSLGLGIMLFGAAPAWAHEHEAGMQQQVKSDMKLTLNGNPLKLDESYLINNSLFVPYRAFAEGIGSEVGYDEATRTVTVKKEGKTVELKIGSSEAVVNGVKVSMVGPAQLINDSTFVHSRFLAEVFGISVLYEESTRTVNLVNGSTDKPVSTKGEVKTYNIEISGFAFKNGDITVEAGSKIVFTNQDSVKHNAVADNGTFKTPLLAKGESATVVISEPGEYTYYCAPHPQSMKGKIIVK
ncbi:stalk domain-containing protein [Paenibacillus sedimenti]|uniref:Cupredoxin domain-containing protein n=1 Tax=Paenibacillus sedimenti TaxID=2770274 RepID=A0A926KUS9_9BACL|nr:stalk domain-containing protein [Paenibacillus sedimenti]MBD0383256.1 cupredoxin domain-containing protein [Paenibacillus sedimenti]